MHRESAMRENLRGERPPDCSRGVPRPARGARDIGPTAGYLGRRLPVRVPGVAARARARGRRLRGDRRPRRDPARPGAVASHGAARGERDRPAGHRPDPGRARGRSAARGGQAPVPRRARATRDRGGGVRLARAVAVRARPTRGRRIGGRRAACHSRSTPQALADIPSCVASQVRGRPTRSACCWSSC